MSDKVGDFLVTDTSPIADFFETVAALVGVPADNVGGLNGVDVLQLYLSSLDKSNVS